MSIYKNINGGTKEVSGLFENKNGGVIEIQSKWENKNGVLRKVYTGIDLPPGPEYPAVPPDIFLQSFIQEFTAGYGGSVFMHPSATFSPGGTNKFTKFKFTLTWEGCYQQMGGTGYPNIYTAVSMNGVTYVSNTQQFWGSWFGISGEITLPNDVKTIVNKGGSIILNTDLRVHFYARGSTYGSTYIRSARFQ